SRQAALIGGGGGAELRLGPANPRGPGKLRSPRLRGAPPMHLDLIAAAAPVFFAAIGVEVVADRSRRTGLYRFGAAMADLEVGIVSQVGDVFLRGIGVAIYASV